MKDRPKEAVLEEIRQKVTLLPGMNVSIGQPISHRIDHMLSGTRANIAVKIFGDDLPTLRSLAKQVNAAMKESPEWWISSVEQQTDIPTMRVKVDQAAASRYGVRTGRGEDAMQTAFLGSEAGQVLEGQVSFPLVVRYRGRQAVEYGRDRGGRRSIRPSARKFRCRCSPRSAKIAGRTSSCGRACNGGLSCSAMWPGRDLRTVVNDIQRRIGSPCGCRRATGSSTGASSRAKPRRPSGSAC